MAYTPALMELQKVAAIVREQDSLLRSRKGQDVRVRHSCICFPGLKRRENVVAQPAQLRHNLQRNVLVGIEAGQLSRLVLAYLCLNLHCVGTGVVPCVHQVFRSQCGISSEQRLLRHA